MFERKTQKPYKPIFRDRVEAAQAPAAITAQNKLGMEAKVAAVMARYQVRKEDLLARIKDRTTPAHVEDHIDDLTKQQSDLYFEILEEQTQAEAKMAEASREDNLVLKKIWWKLPEMRAKFGKRLRSEQMADIEEAQRWFDELDAKRVKIAALSNDLDEAQADLDLAEANQVFYPQSYIDHETDPDRIYELVEAQRKGGPERASKQMTAALERLDRISRTYDLFHQNGVDPHGLDLSESRLLDTVYYVETELLKIAQKGRGRFIGELLGGKESRGKYQEILLDVYKFVVDYVQQAGLKFDESNFEEAFLQGFRITEGSRGSESTAVLNFARNLNEKTPWSDDLGYYTIGAFQLNGFCSVHGIPQNEEAIPYVIAYATGALMSNSVFYVAELLRDWIADVTPIQDFDETGALTSSMARGFGSMMDSSHSYTIRKYGGLDDPVLVKVINSANALVRRFEDVLLTDKMGRYETYRRFEPNRGIKDAELLTTEQLNKRLRFWIG